jgi:hypothetical protein
MSTKVFNVKGKIEKVNLIDYVNANVLSGRQRVENERQLKLSLGWLIYKTNYTYGKPVAPVEISAREYRGDKPMVRDGVELAFTGGIRWGKTPVRTVLWDNLMICRSKGYTVINGGGDKSLKRKDNVPNEWELNTDGLVSIVKLLGVSYSELRRNWVASEVESIIDSRCGEEIRTGRFNYFYGSNPFSSRRYHQLTNLNKELRNHVFAAGGMRHQYDVKSCFPTLLCELSELLAGQSAGAGAGIYAVPSIRHAMVAPDAFRRAVAASCGLYDASGELDVVAVKGVLSALLFGARLVPLSEQKKNLFASMRRSQLPAVLVAVHCDFAAYERVIKSPLVRNYRADIVRFNRLARGKLNELVRSGGHTPEKFMRSPMYLYWVLEVMEARVRNAMCEYVENRYGRVFELHDCVISNLELDVDDLSDWVYEKTGYRVSITHELLDSIG